MLGLTRARLLSLLLAAVAGIAIGVSAWLFTSSGRPSLSRVTDFGIGGPFRLVDQDGRTHTDAEFRGKIMMVEFGYTFCPDVCPLGLQLFAEALELLGPDADSVQPIFITVDPGRDTPELLGAYVEHFSPRILALSGSEQDIATVAKEYRVYFKLGADHKTNPNYTVDHSAVLYLMDRDGKFAGHFTHETSAAELAAAIRALL